MSLVKNFRTLSSLSNRLNRVSQVYNRVNGPINGLFLKQSLGKFNQDFYACRYLSLQTNKAAESLDQDSSHQVDMLFERLDNSIKKFGIINAHNIFQLHSAIMKNKSVTSSQAIFLLQCCGHLSCSESKETKSQMVSKIWDSFNKLGITLDISHYNARLQILLENHSTFSPLEFLATLQEKKIEPNRITFSKIIEKLCRDGDIEAANDIVKFMKEKDLKIKDSIYNSLILGYSRANNLESAIAILKEMEENDVKAGPETYETLLQVYAEHNNAEEVKNLLRRYDEEEIFIHGSGIFEVIYNLAEQNKLEMIPEILTRVKQFTGLQYKYMNIICRLINIEKEDVAYQIFQKLPKKEGNRHIGSFFPRELGYAKLPLEKVTHYCEELKNNEWNVMSYEYALKGYLSAEDIDKSLALIDVMSEKGIPLRIHYFYPIFVALRKTKDTEKTWEVIKEMKKYNVRMDGMFIQDYVYPALSSDNFDASKAFVKLSGEGIEGSIGMIYSAFINGILKNEGLQATAKFVNNIRRGAHLYVVPSLLHEYLNSFDAKSAACVLRQLLPLANRINKIEDEFESSDVHNQYNGIKDFLIKAIRSMIQNNALSLDQHLTPLLNEMLAEGVRINSSCLTAIIHQFDNHLSSQHKDILHKLNDRNLVPKLVKRSIDDGMVNQLGNVNNPKYEFNEITMAARGDDVSKAQQIYEDMKANDKDIPRPIMMMVALKYIEHEDYLDEAEKIFQTIKDEYPEFQSSARSNLKFAFALVKTNRLQDAAKALMLYAPSDGVWVGKDVKPAEEDFLYRSFLIKILDAACASKDLASLQLLQEALISKNYASSSRILSYIVKYYLEVGETDKALEQYLKMLKEYNVEFFKVPLLTALVKEEKTEKIQEVVDSSLQGESNALCDLAFGFIEAGKLKHAIRLMESYPVNTVKKKLEYRCRFYLRSKQMNLIEDLIEVTKGVLGNDREFLYEALLDGYIDIKDTKKALNTWVELQEDGIVASHEFLYKLGKFLQANNCEVPFETPAWKSTVNRTNSFHSEPRLPSRMSTTASKSEPKSYSIEEIKEALISDQPVNIRQLRDVVHNLRQSGDIENLRIFSKYLSKDLNREVRLDVALGMAYSTQGRVDEYLALLNSLDESNNFRNFPFTVMQNIVENNPDYLPKVESHCSAQAGKGFLNPVTNLMNIFLVTGKQEDAIQIHDKYLSSSSEFGLRSVIAEAHKKNDLNLFQQCFDLVNRKPEGREQLRAFLLSQYIEFIIRKKHDCSKALTAIEENKDIFLQYVSLTTMTKLKEVATSAGLTFPYEIPASDMKRLDTSSSSSSSDDENRK